MDSSSYYYNLMNKYKEEIETLTKEKEKYELVLPKLKELASKIPEVSTKLNESETAYLNGGFVSDNESFDRGVLKECYGKLDNDSEKISYISSKVQNKIDELLANIERAKQNLESATSNYYSALSRERAGE